MTPKKACHWAVLNDTKRKLALLSRMTTTTRDLKSKDEITPLELLLILTYLYLVWVKRNGVTSFVVKLGMTSARRIAPVDTGLQSLVLLPTGGGTGSVLWKIHQIIKKICSFFYILSHYIGLKIIAQNVMSST